MFVSELSDKATSESLLAAAAGYHRRRLQLGALELVLAAEHAAALPGKAPHTVSKAAVRTYAAAMAMDKADAREYLELAVTVTTRLPNTLAAMQDGDIDDDCARRVAAATKHLTDEQVAICETEILSRIRAEDWAGAPGR